MSPNRTIVYRSPAARFVDVHPDRLWHWRVLRHDTQMDVAGEAPSWLAARRAASAARKQSRRTFGWKATR